MLALVLALLQQDASFARAESLLGRQDLRAARVIAEQLVRTHPNDPAAHRLLGRIWLAWPVVGRYQALEEFRTAARLAPADPEPLYWQIRVGQYLGSDEGERMMREALLRILAIWPGCRGCWETFGQLYHSPDIWRQADRALARHPNDPFALAHRAEIAIALEEPGRAYSLAAAVLALRPHDVPAYLWRAEAGFQGGRDAIGYAWYDSALSYADLDSTEAIWEQVWGIASADEIRAYERTGPGQLRQFFDRFWGKRDPNLLTRENERIAEHFRRLDYVRKMFHLLHPQSIYYRSPLRRALVAAGGRSLPTRLVPEGTDSARTPGALPPSIDARPSLPGLSTPGIAYRTPIGTNLLASGDSLSFFSGAGPDLRAVADTNGQLGTSRTGLDPRGLVWLRHGQPHERLTGVLDPMRPQRLVNADLDLESWLYDTPEGPLTIAFVRGTGGLAGGHFGGDFVFYPVTQHQVRSAEHLLASDETRLAAELPVRTWIAAFQGDRPGTTALYAKAVAPQAAMVLWDTATAEEIGRSSGPDLLEVSVRPGAYALGFDVAVGDKVGRARRRIHIPLFRPDTLSLAGIALAPGDALLDREGALAAMPADLMYPSGKPLVSYAEIYGLTADAQGLARYQVRYTFAPVRSLPGRLLGGASPVVFEFTREALARGAVPERLVIEPGRVAAGRYRVTLAVTDLGSNVKSQTVALEITIR